MNNFNIVEILEEKDFATNYQQMLENIDAYARDEREYEEKLFAESCVYDASEELPF